MTVANYASPLPCNLSRASISSLAENFANEIGYIPGEQLEAIVSKLGGEIEYQDFWDLHNISSGSIEIDGPANFRIYLGMHTSSDRDRFTIGHELGHYVLHYLYPQAKGSTVSPTKADRYGTGRTEYEANWFAASFLMPHEAFKIAYNSARGNLCEVAEKFHVSLSAASVRARALTLE